MPISKDEKIAFLRNLNYVLDQAFANQQFHESVSSCQAVTGHFKMHHLWPLQSAPPWERLVFSLMVGLYKGGFARLWWLCWRV
jgi:hypothetical protein